MNSTYASRTSSSESSQELIPSEFQTYIQMLSLLPSGQGKHTAFTGFMYVRMVTEICNRLGIPCMAGVSIDEKRQVGNQNLCVRDIVQELKVDGRPFKSIGTYQNYRGWMNNASRLLSCMETEGHKDSPTECHFLKRTRDLLTNTTPCSHGFERK
jgi:hypothetical protein